MKVDSTFVPADLEKVSTCIHCGKRCMTYLKCGRHTWNVFMFAAYAIMTYNLLRWKIAPLRGV